MSLDHIKVYSGAEKPLCRPGVHAPDIHGESGIDGTDLLPEVPVPPKRDITAVDAMRGALMSQPAGMAYLVATGALTNVSRLFAQYPELVAHIRGLSIMGGAVGGGFTGAVMGKVDGEGERFGNTTPYAEFNIYCDPEAAQSLLSNTSLAAKTTLITLDLTHQVLATSLVQEMILNSPTPDPQSTPPPTEIEPLTLRPMLHDLLTFFATTYAHVYGITAGPPLHDPLAVAVVLDEIGAESVRFDDSQQRYTVNVDTGMGEQAGRTVIRRASGGGGGVRIPRHLDIGRFWNVVEQCIVRAEDLLRADRAADGHSLP